MDAVPRCCSIVLPKKLPLAYQSLTSTHTANELLPRVVDRQHKPSGHALIFSLLEERGTVCEIPPEEVSFVCRCDGLHQLLILPCLEAKCN